MKTPAKAVAAALSVVLLAGCGSGGSSKSARSRAASRSSHSVVDSHETTEPSAGSTTSATYTRTSRPTHRPSPSRSSSTSKPPALRTCDLGGLPTQARDTANLIVEGGPFPYPRNDGVTYFNRSKVLPQRATGAYREFTVKTPGAPTRGTRRIITDGNPTSGAPTTSPSAWYYTDDHYNTFCSLTGTP